MVTEEEGLLMHHVSVVCLACRRLSQEFLRLLTALRFYIQCFCRPCEKDFRTIAITKPTLSVLPARARWAIIAVFFGHHGRSSKLSR